MVETISQFYSDAQMYVGFVDVFAKKHSLYQRVEADHLCYKCDSKESFERMRSLFEHESVYIYQSIISNRRIAYIRLAQGIETSLGTVVYLELCDQKPDGSQKEGFDHIEVFPLTIGYTQMVALLQKTETVIHVERPHHTTDDVEIGGGFLFRCTQGPLIGKIKASEMV